MRIIFIRAFFILKKIWILYASFARFFPTCLSLFLWLHHNPFLFWFSFSTGILNTLPLHVTRWFIFIGSCSQDQNSNPSLILLDSDGRSEGLRAKKWIRWFKKKTVLFLWTGPVDLIRDVLRDILKGLWRMTAHSVRWLWRFDVGNCHGRFHSKIVSAHWSNRSGVTSEVFITY